jgi:hypothetical protein
MPAEIGSDSISKVEVTVKSYAIMNQSSGVLDRVDCCGCDDPHRPIPLRIYRELEAQTSQIELSLHRRQGLLITLYSPDLSSSEYLNLITTNTDRAIPQKGTLWGR